MPSVLSVASVYVCLPEFGPRAYQTGTAEEWCPSPSDWWGLCANSPGHSPLGWDNFETHVPYLLPEFLIGISPVTHRDTSPSNVLSYWLLSLRCLTSPVSYLCFLTLSLKWATCTQIFILRLSSRAGVSNSLSLGATSASQFLQRAKIILGLYKYNYSLTVKELKLHLALWRQSRGWYVSQWKLVWHPCSGVRS